MQNLVLKTTHRGLQAQHAKPADPYFFLQRKEPGARTCYLGRVRTYALSLTGECGPRDIGFSISFFQFPPKNFELKCTNLPFLSM